MPPTTPHELATRFGTLLLHVHEPPSAQRGASPITLVTVHPWATLGGGEHNTYGLAQKLAALGMRTISFDLISSTAVGGVFTRHSKEVEQVRAVVAWAAERRWGGESGGGTSRVALVGSSAGAPIAGSALKGSAAVGIACIGYTFGWLSSIAFGGHYRALLSSDVPKLLLQARPRQPHTRDRRHPREAHPARPPPKCVADPAHA